jgi:hypothetical protein
MARIRTIKPEFWTSEQIAECSPNARLLFIGMWSFADDSGVHPDSSARLKMQIFPADAFGRDKVEAMLCELADAGLIQRYVTDSGEKLLHVCRWSRHQKIDQPTYRYPLPDGKIPTNVRRTSFGEHSPDSATNVRGGKGHGSIKSKSLRARRQESGHD